MDVGALATQQAVTQARTSITAIKLQAQSEKAIAEMVAKAADENKGRNLDIFA